MLRIEGLAAGYGEVDALSGIDLHIEAKESVAIVGANGAGKSTLVRAVCGLIPARCGRIVKDGREIQGLPAYRRAALGIAVVLESRHLFGELSLRSNLELAVAKGSRAQGQRLSVDDVLDLFPFMRERQDAPVDLLSGGEQQMVAIGRALLLNPDLLILDEPSTGLAPKVVRDIVNVIGGLRQRGMSLLLVEQNIGIARESADRGYVMSLGRIVGTIDHDGWANLHQADWLVRAYLGSS